MNSGALVFLTSCLLLVVATSCIGAPTPLAPNFRGSVGLPHQGAQTDAVELPYRGTGYRRYRPRGSAYWAQPELVSAIQKAAANVHERFPGGADLVLGDFSARWGGRIPRHNSHRSGRDVDLLWYVMTPGGRPTLNPGFIRLGADGLAHDPSSGAIYRLDVERQWHIVKELMLSDEIDVQWMFLSRAVEAILIEYARARGEPDELIWAAQNVMLQPGDSLPHDDHIHLRISCNKTTSVTGCAGGGPHWEWLPPLPALAPLTHQDLLEIGRQDPLSVQVAAKESGDKEQRQGPG